jgi:chemosensory pili system protein ChpA (sensor histidine kinase/response regulator)
LRPRYQLGLLGWIKGQAVDTNLRVMGEVADRLEQAANSDIYRRLWWVEGGVLEALCDGGLETGVALKRLLGQADRAMKVVMDKGEQGLNPQEMDELVNNLLYYVARASSSGPRITAIRQGYNLENLLPADNLVEKARESLSGPSVKLMKTVAAAIKEDLSKVKDVLDIYVRTGMGEVDELMPQVEMLKKISDTLGVLGLGSLRSNIQTEIGNLGSIVSGESEDDDEVLERIAATLLHVEDTIDEQLLRLILPASDLGQELEDTDIDYQQVTDAVLRECAMNISRIKEAISSALGNSDETKSLDAIPGQFRGINAALLMLNRTRAVSVVERIARLFREGDLNQVYEWPSVLLDRLADAIVSVEYYLETVRAGRADPFYMLDNADRCLDMLGQTREELNMAVRADAMLQSVEGTVVLEREGDELEASTSVESGQEQPPQAPVELPVPQPPLLPVSRPEAAGLDELRTVEGRPDPEIMELFIEEAKEEAQVIREQLPAVESNFLDSDAIARMRRAFHTLKGSGRMVGAEAIAEFSWSIENVLNRVIAGHLVFDATVYDLLSAASQLLPELIEQLEVGTPPPAELARLAARARTVAEGVPEQPQAEELVEEATEEAPAMDPVLKDIFTKETAEHLAVIRAFLNSAVLAEAPYGITPELHRSCHTLSGSANMADVQAGVSVADPWNKYIRKLYDAGEGLSDEALIVCQKVVAAVEEIVEHLDDGPIPAERYAPIASEIASLLRSFEAERARIEQEQARELPVQEEPAGKPEMEFDAEIAAIFCEEAGELLESMEDAFHRWVGGDNDQEAVAEFKRHLHTLKGGARMAGLGAMGDLSHELETLLMRVTNGEVPMGASVESVFQKGTDGLHRMRDVAASGQRVSQDHELLALVKAAEAGELPPVSGPPEVVEGQPGDEAEWEPGAELELEPEAPGEPEAQSEWGVAPEGETQVPPGSEIEAVWGLEPTAESEAWLGAESTTEPEARFEAEPEVELEPEPETEPEIDYPAQRDAGFARAGGDSGPGGRQDVARVDTNLLDDLLNYAGEVTIFRSRLEQQVKSIDFNVQELSQTVTRLKDQLRKLEMETEAQILHRHQDDAAGDRNFDPLEMDRYSLIQQLSRGLAETSSDVDSIKTLIQGLVRDADSLLVQQGRAASGLQDGLMRTRMVPFARYVQRLTRVVRQIAQETGHRAELRVEGAGAELDRQVVEKMLPCLEHMLRNAVIHGIEPPAERTRRGKAATGVLTVALKREGSQVIIDVGDDGRGLDLGAIRARAVQRGLVRSEQILTMDQAIQLVFEPGFSTAESVTQSAGRGVGMDVVASQVRKLGGSVSLRTVSGEGTVISTRLPFSMAISQAMVVRVADELFAVPLPTVEGVVRIPKSELETKLAYPEDAFMESGGHAYRLQYLAHFLGLPAGPFPEEELTIPVTLVRAGEASAALIADEMLGSREIVVKSVGPQLSTIQGLAGATILGDGRVALILDAPSLLRARSNLPTDLGLSEELVQRHQTVVMVVDDSITVRRVTQRLLERNGMKVVTARDGLDALEQLQEIRPDVMLLDIEMPRMDGYELASSIRKDSRLANIPIIMITSRVGQKHRARAIEIGVDDYLGKPYQESQLLDAIEQLIQHGRTNVY